MLADFVLLVCRVWLPAVCGVMFITILVACLFFYSCWKLCNRTIGLSEKMSSPILLNNSDIIRSSLTFSAQYCAFCFAIHFLFYLVSARVISGFTKLPIATQASWHNRGVSITHASIMFYLTVNYWLYINPSMEISSLISVYQSRVIDIMMGYLWYDMYIELTTTKQADTLAHHILGLISHLTTRFMNSGPAMFYSMLVYIAEGSTPFLHTCWLLNFLNMKNSIVFLAIAGVLIISFFFCRVVTAPYIVWHMYTNRGVWPAGDGWLLWSNFGIVVFFTLLNWYWFAMLVKMALKPAKSDKKE
jgi:hypothetical protein